MSEEKSIQEQIEDAMPPNFGYETDGPENGELRATHEELLTIQQTYGDITQMFIDRGFSQNELRIPLHSVEHSVNAGRFDPQEYDRIAFNIELRGWVEEWREEQDADVSDWELARGLDVLAEYYRTKQRSKDAEGRER